MSATPPTGGVSPASVEPLFQGGRRVLHFPVQLPSPKRAREVLAVAAALAQGDHEGAVRAFAQVTPVPSEAVGLEEIGASGECVIPSLRAKVLSRILLDLSEHGWDILLEESQIYVRAPDLHRGGGGLAPEEALKEKERVRKSLEARVDAQLQRAPTKAFIADQERLRYREGGPRSIVSLIADGPSLAASLREQGAGAVRPYLQVAHSEAGLDIHTGLRFTDIFRYFRYFWSFPFESTPGRTLPFLVRDAGQPDHPVCGLLCLASPVPKMSVRDAALGWTPFWLEAVVAGLDALSSRDHLQEHARAWALAVRHLQLSAGVAERRVVRDLCRLFRVPLVGGWDELVRQLSRLRANERTQRAQAARRRILNDLVGEVRRAIESTSFDGLGIRITREGALANPQRAVEVLSVASKRLREAWTQSRELGGSLLKVTPRDNGRGALFKKKRSAALESLLRAWSDLAENVDPKRVAESLRYLTFGRRERWADGDELTGGARVGRGLSEGIKLRRSRLAASQVLDVSVCGAVPPYNQLLGGKLVSMLALTSDVAAEYYKRYSNQVSEISSQMAGEKQTRPADLLALTTTSFYSVGSSQYNRVMLPDELGSVGWERIGRSAGHGTMQFSRETSELVRTLVEAESGHRLITSMFGEGPSERLRKLRDGFVRLALPANELIRHGMFRIVYLAECDPGAIRPGGKRKSASWRSRGPVLGKVVQYWRQRWLTPRLERMPGVIDAVERFDRNSVRLSLRTESLPTDQAQPRLF